MLSLSITEFDVQALVDSHLPWEEEKRVLRGIRSDPALQAYYKQIVAQKKLLIFWSQNKEPRKGMADGIHTEPLVPAAR